VKKKKKKKKVKYVKFKAKETKKKALNLDEFEKELSSCVAF
jgi:hypothetical protein